MQRAKAAKRRARTAPGETVAPRQTDFVITGFPKCGTTALAHFIENSPVLNLAKMDGAYEAPFFVRDVDPSPNYVSDRVNGHKFAAYALSLNNLKKIYAANSETLFIFCVRDSKAALFSWHKMHRTIAERGTPTTHFVNATPERRDFYRNCSVADYFEKYADEKLEYAHKIERFIKAHPDAHFVVITQGALAQQAADAMVRLHTLLGVEAPASYLATLPPAHESFGDAKARDALPVEIEASLAAKDKRLAALLQRLDDKFKVTL